MLEFAICSFLTILPDYLVRRYVQGKRIGHEITLYSVWYELRYGISACAILTVSLITVIFFYHPSASNVVAGFRTVTILPETPGRVEEVLVVNGQRVEAGDPIFRLDDARQRTALNTATSRLDEIDAQIVMAAADLDTATAQVAQGQALLAEYRTELARTQELLERGSSAVSQQEFDRQSARVAAQEAAVQAAISQEASARARVDTLLPAQRVSAEASVAQAQVELDLTTVYAGTNGMVQQFALQVGDYVSSLLRPAGIIIPEASGELRMQAAFGQISSSVLKVGMLAEVTCPCGAIHDHPDGRRRHPGGDRHRAVAANRSTPRYRSAATGRHGSALHGAAVRMRLSTGKFEPNITRHPAAELRRAPSRRSGGCCRTPVQPWSNMPSHARMSACRPPADDGPTVQPWSNIRPLANAQVAR
jgi:multidrug resistance efflux pump